MKTLKVRPILVETKENTGITLGINITRNIPGAMRGQNYELILISLEDEKIEVGDKWIYICPIHGIDYGDNGEAVVTNNIPNGIKWFNKLHDKKNYHKVIATQDQLSPELIQQLIVEYNNGDMKDFEIEMEDKIAIDGYTIIGIEPKLTNSFVTIVKKKQITYTEQDIRDAFEAGYKRGWSGYPNTDNWTQPTFEEWLNKNKKI